MRRVGLGSRRFLRARGRVDLVALRQARCAWASGEEIGTVLVVV